jgi:malonyl CoA-acyl carrier protein transacylase
MTAISPLVRSSISGPPAGQREATSAAPREPSAAGGAHRSAIGVRMIVNDLPRHLVFGDGMGVGRAGGLAMQSAVAPGEGAMSAVISVDASTLEEVCAEVTHELGEVVACANYNAPGQIVIAGTARAVARAGETARERAKAGGSARTSSIPLKVSAPFHSALMRPAAEAIARELGGITVAPLAFPVVANFDAVPNTDPARVKDLLVRQVDGAVRWEQAVRVMAEAGVTHALEIGPGKVLAGLGKRIAALLHGDPHQGRELWPREPERLGRDRDRRRQRRGHGDAHDRRFRFRRGGVERGDPQQERRR